MLFEKSTPGGNGGSLTEPRDSMSGVLLHDSFAAQAKARPEHPAVICKGEVITYRDLDQETNRWARYLRDLGVKPNSLVGVVMEKGVEQIIATLATLKAGGAYLPIDVDLPSERLAYILANSTARIVLTQSQIDQRLSWPSDVERVQVDDSDIRDVSCEPLQSVQSADDLAFVIYTSGSTGQPKGVMLTHRGVVNCIECTNETFSITPEDRVLALTALHHDMSVFDIFGVLAAGGTIVMPDAVNRKDPAHWSQLMREYGVTIWNSVPAMMEMLLEYAEQTERAIPDSLRLAFLGGDWISVTLPDRLRSHTERARVVSVGGPTETTLWNIWYPVDEVDPTWKSIPYGKPIRKTKYFVMNESLEECPMGTPGELCCAGVGIAKGYLNDEEKTAAKFTSHPKTGERIYRTGDMGRFLPDGNIEFLGREDNQVKINGQRIELGEIESVLQKHPHVRAAVVLASGERHGEKSLVAYVVPASCMAVAEPQLRDYLSKQLPPHMVPSRLCLLDKLPLTANGKVDRGALPNLDGRRPELATPYIEPTSQIERDLSAIWRGLLNLDRVGTADNLFDLGAQSIHVVQAHARLKSVIDTELGIVTLFQYPTIGALANYLASNATRSDATRSIQARAERRRAAQERMKSSRRRTSNV